MDGSVTSREASGVPFLRRALNADPTKDALEKLGASKAIGVVEKHSSDLNPSTVRSP
jgi:hypothetical protein